MANPSEVYFDKDKVRYTVDVTLCKLIFHDRPGCLGSLNWNRVSGLC